MRLEAIVIGKLSHGNNGGTGYLYKEKCFSRVQPTKDGDK